jgi:hypothetical protein
VVKLKLPRTLIAAWALLALAFTQAAGAATPVHIVRADLKPLIRAAYDSPVQFAVLVPHAASTTNAGIWSVAGDRATWRYAVQVPTAVSLSFHATGSSLPESATLVVRGAKTTTSYGARDLHRGELWSRIHPGEALQLTLTVAAADRSKVVLNIISLQAGYRSLGAGVEDHPYYRRLMAQANAATGNASCVTNYECQVTPSNSPLAAATVALVIGNLYQCSGVLINDVPGDNTPYVLTARHCETGQLGGGNAGAASTVTVYWDATSACGATLGSLYDGQAIVTQTGAQTRVEQQDAWLIELDASPVATDAQFAGFDASGGAVQGGYTIHHAEGHDKQYVGWYSQAATVQLPGSDFGVGYLSNFWETVNQIGNIGPGASGSGLFDQSNHLVGSLTFGRRTSDPSGYEACPITPIPPVPNGSNGVADFTSFAAVWNSTADTTSTTGGATLKSMLDPANTGTVVVASQPAAVVTFSANEETVTNGVLIGLTWKATNATQCTAGGGVSGDGWSGTLAASGSQPLTESSPGIVTYTISCTFPGGRIAKGSTAVTWVGPTPLVQLAASPSVVWATTPVNFIWTSNVAPCSLTGGGVSLTNLAASGTVPVIQNTTGDVLYTMTCGPANDSGSMATLVQWISPSLSFFANGTDRLLGAVFTLQWGAAPNAQCIPSGGAPNDGWSETTFHTGSGVAYPKVVAVGTFTYSLTCSAGPLSLQKSVTVTFEQNAPYVTASLSSPSVTFTDSPADYVMLTYDSNLSACTLITNPNLPLTNSGSLQFPPDPQGLIAFAPARSGSYQISFRCTASIGGVDDNATVGPLTLTVSPPPPPAESLAFTPGSTVVVEEPFTISWSSTNAQSCNQTGAIPGENMWGGPQGMGKPPSGHVDVLSASAGQFTLGLICQSIDPNTASTSTSVTLNVVNLTATLTATPTSVTSGSSFTLDWSSTGATGCSASGGGANGSPWSGSLGTSGSVTQTATTTGSFTYMINCALGNEVAMGQAAVTVSAPAGGGGGGGGHGGGGALGFLEVGALAALLGLRAIRRRQRPARRACASRSAGSGAAFPRRLRPQRRQHPVEDDVLAHHLRRRKVRAGYLGRAGPLPGRLERPDADAAPE